MNYGKSSKPFGTIKAQVFPRATLHEIIRGLLTAAVAFLLGICRLPFSVYPFGIAFVCAATGSTVPSAAGLIAAALFAPLNKSVYLLSAVFTVALRILVRLFIDPDPNCGTLRGRMGDTLFHESLPLRAACAAVSAFVLSLYPIITGGFRYYDLFGAILSIAASAAATLLFYGAFKSTANSPESFRTRLYSLSARIALSALLCLSLSRLPIRGFEPALTLAFLLTLNFCLKDGLAQSCLCAVLCGAVCGLENIPVLVIAAFTAFCVLDVSPSLAAAVACISGSVCGVMISGSTYMTSPFLSLLFGCTLFATLKKLNVRELQKDIQADNTSTLAQARLDKTAVLLDSTQSSLRSLSSEFSHLKYADELIDTLKKESADESGENGRLSQTIAGRLHELGFGKVSVSVTGKRNVCLRLCGERLAGKPERAEFIRRQAEALVGFPLTRAEISENGRSMRFLRDSVVSYHHSLSQLAKEEVCGDTAEVFFDDRRNYLYAVICDGMGSGGEANKISARSAAILKALVCAGTEPKRALAILGELLRESGAYGEMSTTVDLLRLDLYTGEGVVIKSGAAPSYVKRGGEMTELCAKTLPIGILDFTDAKEIKFTAKENDVIIMVSDGVAECESDSLPIAEYLNANKKALPKEIANGIIDVCRKNGKSDDLSVIAIKIFPQNY